MNGKSQIGTVPLALSSAALYVVVAGAAGYLIPDTRPSRPAAATAAATADVAPTDTRTLPMITTTTTTPPIPTTTAPPPNTTAPPAGFQPVEAPGGLVTIAPEGWPVATGTVATTLVVTDPANRRREVRLGGAPVTDPARPLLDRITAAAVEREREPGHTRLALAGTRIREFPGVRWEFEHVVDGTSTRAAVVYWETNGIEYVIYSAGPPEEWAATQSRLTAMSDFARP